MKKVNLEEEPLLSCARCGVQGGSLSLTCCVALGKLCPFSALLLPHPYQKIFKLGAFEIPASDYIFLLKSPHEGPEFEGG